MQNYLRTWSNSILLLIPAVVFVGCAGKKDAERPAESKASPSVTTADTTQAMMDVSRGESTIEGEWEDINYDEQVISDPLTRKQLTYQGRGRRLKNPDEYDSDNPYIFEKNWLVITEPQTPVIEQINKRIRQILLEQPDSDTFKVKLLRDYKRKLNTYVRVNSTIKDTLGVFSREVSFPDIGRIDYVTSLCSQSVLTLAAIFHYDTHIPNDSGEEHKQVFSGAYYETYYFDINTGKEFRFNDVFKPGSLVEIRRMIQDQAAEKMKSVNVTIEPIDFVITESEEYEDPEEVKRILNSRNKKLLNLSLQEDGVLLPQAASFEYMIPERSPCTLNMYGMGISAHLAFDAVKNHLNPQGPFANLIDNLPPPNHLLKNNERFPKSVNESVSQSLELLDDRITPLSLPGVKKISVYIQCEGTGKTVLHKENHYLKNGLLEKVVYDQDHIYAFSYDSRQNLASVSWPPDEGEQITSKYVYDSNNNLILSQHTGTREPASITYYTYYNGFYIQEYFDNPEFGHEYEIVKVNSDGDKIYTAEEIIKKYDDKGRLVLLWYKPEKPEADFNEQEWIKRNGKFYTYNAAGDLTVYKTEEGTHNYQYDAQHRLIEETMTRRGYPRPRYARKITAYDLKNRPLTIQLQHEEFTQHRICTFTLKYEEW